MYKYIRNIPTVYFEGLGVVRLMKIPPLNKDRQWKLIHVLRLKGAIERIALIDNIHDASEAIEVMKTT